MKHASRQTPSAYEVKAAVENLGRTFEEFKSANNAADIERRSRGYVDTVLEEKLARINQDVSGLQSRIDKLQIASNRPYLGKGGLEVPEQKAHKTAFYDRYVRKGYESGLGDLEQKALSIGVDAEGGYTVPEELDHSIESLLKDISPIRSIANVVQIGTANYRKLVNLSDTASGWASETGARLETDSPQFAEVVPPLGELYANPAASQAMLDDAFFNVEEWLAGELANEFGQKEGTAFVNGDGVNKPRGFLDYATSASEDTGRAFGTLQHVATGVDGAFSGADPADILVDLVYSLRPVYRAGASFVMNTNLVAEIRKFKDADGNYLWRPGFAENAPATLLGYPVIEAEDMPDRASGSSSVAFGNFNRGYIVTDRTGTRILRDPFSNKPFVHFYATKRVGGGVVNSEAIKLLKFSLS